jgi:hypothetical protein
MPHFSTMIRPLFIKNRCGIPGLKSGKEWKLSQQKILTPGRTI